MCDNLFTPCRPATRTPTRRQGVFKSPGLSLGGTFSRGPPKRKTWSVLTRHYQHYCSVTYVCTHIGMLRLQPIGKTPPSGLPHFLCPQHLITGIIRLNSIKTTGDDPRIAILRPLNAITSVIRPNPIHTITFSSQWNLLNTLNLST